MLESGVRFRAGDKDRAVLALGGKSDEPKLPLVAGELWDSWFRSLSPLVDRMDRDLETVTAPVSGLPRSGTRTWI